VEAPQIATFENHVHTLEASPLFYFSLASKELFHSNFLAWLCENYPIQVGPLFATFTKNPCDRCDHLEVHREQRNIDLTIIFPNEESLIIENKVKSIATIEQLQGYSRQVRDKERTSFLLLSLIRPAFVPSNDALFKVDETVWHFCSYDGLARQLEPFIACISARDKYHGEIVKDYLGFVKSLVAIASHVSVDWGNEDADFFGKDESKLLKKIRLRDMMDKIRYAQLAQRIKETLKAEGCCVVPDKEFKTAPPGVFTVDSAFYRGEALCQFWYHLRGAENKVALGVMFQGNKIKVSVHAGRDSAKRIAEELIRPNAGGSVWFDLARIPGDSREMPRKKGFCQYSGINYHRYKKIAQISPKGIVDLLVSYARSIRDAEDTIQKRIDAVGVPG
jgi:hypothetical protein